MYYVTGAIVLLYIDGINTLHIFYNNILMALGFLLIYIPCTSLSMVREILLWPPG